MPPVDPAVVDPDAPRARADAVRRDPGASHARALAAGEVEETGRAVVSAQLGRPARGRTAVVHRCAFGLPTVVRVDPRLEDGTPFPTTFWLTCPVLRARIGGLEGDGAMRGLNDRLGEDPAFAGEHAASHERYRATRDQLDEPLPGEPYAGGGPEHIKCLHVHVAHHLATGDDPVGTETFDALAPVACAGPCVDEGARGHVQASA